MTDQQHNLGTTADRQFAAPRQQPTAGSIHEASNSMNSEATSLQLATASSNLSLRCNLASVTEWLSGTKDHRHGDPFDKLVDSLTLRDGFSRDLASSLIWKYMMNAVSGLCHPTRPPCPVLVLEGPPRIGKAEWLRGLLPKALHPANWVMQLPPALANGREISTVQRAAPTRFWASTVDASDLFTPSGAVEVWPIPVLEVSSRYGVNPEQLWARAYVTQDMGAPLWLHDDEDDALSQHYKGYRGTVSRIRVRLLAALQENKKSSWTRPLSSEKILDEICIHEPTKVERLECEELLRDTVGPPIQVDGRQLWEVSL